MAAVFVVMSDPPFSRRSTSPSDRMRIVEANEALAVSRMECQRIVETMRPFRRRLDTSRDEFHPMFADRIDNKHYAIEGK